MNSRNKLDPSNLMDPTDFQVGYKYLINEVSWIVTFINPAIDVVRLREVAGSKKWEDTIKGFKNRIRKGSAKLQRGVALLTLAALTEAALTDEERRSYERRKAYVELMDKLPTAVSKAVRAAAITKLHSDRTSQQMLAGMLLEDQPKLPTVYEWWRSVKRANGLTIVLAIKDHRNKKRECRLSDDVFDMLRESFEQMYKSEQRFTISDIHSVITARIHLENENRDPALPPLKIPARKTISRHLTTFDPLGAFEARFGKHKTRMSFNYGGSLSAPDAVCGLVYCDSHLLDLQVLDERLDIKYRPWLLVLLCAKTRCVIGYDLSVLPPCAEKITRALRMALSESNESPFRGAPAILPCDNGSEFRNGTHYKIAKILNFQIVLPPPRTPNSKAPIERFFRTINFLIHRLSGTTRSNPFDRGDYDSEGNAIYTIAQVLEIFRDILNIYHHRSRSNFGQAPKTLWEIHAPKLPPRVYDPEFIKTLGLLIVNRCINKGRVEIKDLFWHSAALPELKLRLEKSGKKALVHYDPNDLTYVWVRHPDEPDIVVQCGPCDEDYQPGLTMKMHEHILQERRQTEAETGNTVQMHFLKARFLLKALQDAQEKNPKTRKTNRARVEWHDQLIRVADTMNDVVLNPAAISPPAAVDSTGQPSISKSPIAEAIPIEWDDVPNEHIAPPTGIPPKSDASDWDDIGAAN